MEEEEAKRPSRVPAAHIKKRALKNKALSVSFNEKDLKDYVTGFHKRKKKRRKEAQQQLQEAERRKRIEARKKRKLEREFAIYGGTLPDSSAGRDESGEDCDGNEEVEPAASLSGTTMYDSGDVRVTVTTSEISRGEEDPIQRLQLEAPQLVGGSEKQKQNLSISRKKLFKKVSKRRSRPKPQAKRDKKKGKKKNKKR